MKIDFHLVLTGRTAASAKQLLSGPYLGSGIFFAALSIRRSLPLEKSFIFRFVPGPQMKITRCALFGIVAQASPFR
jgi:hypothetical protein